MEIKDMIAVLQAAERGEEIEHYDKLLKEWIDCKDTLEKTPAWNFGVCDYRIKPKPKLVPLEPSDVPPGSVVRNSHEHHRYWYIVQAVHDTGFSIHRNDGFMPYLDAQLTGWEISRDGGSTWSKCEKEAK